MIKCSLKNIQHYTFRNSAGNTVGIGPHSAPSGGSSKRKPPALGEQQSKVNSNRRSGSINSLEQISPWLVSSDISSKKDKERSKIPQLKTVITTEL